MINFSLSLGIAAATPPLTLLIYYYWRFCWTPSLLRLLLFFFCGAISGFFALAVEGIVETQLNSLAAWRAIKRTLAGIALRQLLEVGPIEEGCKFIAVLIPSWYFQRRYRLRSSTIFLFTVAVTLGFTAEENWIYLFYDTASFFDRAVGTPVHTLFSAPWGYALAMTAGATSTPSRRSSPKILPAWLNSVICHALVNVLSNAWRYPAPISFLSYALFPFLLWMFWRLEQLLRKVNREVPIVVIFGRTSLQRMWKRGLVFFILMLGGNAILGLFLLLRSIIFLEPSQLFDRKTLWFLFSRLLFNLIFALIAWKIYCYLRNLARRQLRK